jgi:uncharacterized protein YecA (UPF0149 family)
MGVNPLSAVRPVRVSELQTNRQEEGVKKPQAGAVAEEIGRNDPCPCGSGKKYKRCCGG